MSSDIMRIETWDGTDRFVARIHPCGEIEVFHDGYWKGRGSVDYWRVVAALIQEAIGAQTKTHFSATWEPQNRQEGP